LVIVDYVQLMRSSRPQQRGYNQWSMLTEITQDLKQIARSVGIPILAAAQTNRDGGKQGAELDNIGGSISITQDADVAVGLYADDDMKDAKTMQIRLMKNRRGKLGKFDSRWDHEKGDFKEIGKYERPKERRGDLEEQVREKQSKPPRRRKPGT
jgi:replicative DNA helicase